MTSTAVAATRPKANLGHSVARAEVPASSAQDALPQVRARLGAHQVAHRAIDRRVELRNRREVYPS